MKVFVKTIFVIVSTTTAHVGGAAVNARLLARSQHASGGSGDRPSRPKFSIVSVSLGANSELVPEIHVALHASLAALSRVQNFRQKATPKREHNFFIVLPSKHTVLAKYSVLSSAAYTQQFTSHQLNFFTSQLLSCYQPTFTRRTSGHYLGSFRVAEFSDPPQLTVIISVVPLSASSFFHLLLVRQP